MLEKLTYGKTFCTLEYVSKGGKELINGLVLSKSKKELVHKASFEIDDMTKLPDYISPKQHLFLIINTNKVLFKSLDGVLESRKAVQLAFPNLRLEDFYYETHTAAQNTIVAICRKEDVKLVLNSYKEKNHPVIGFSLGNLSISWLENLVGQDEITTSNATVRFVDQKITDISLNNPKKQSVNINGLKLNSTAILALSGILRCYTNASKTVSNFNSVNTGLKVKFKQQHVFNLGLKISLATIFVLLLFSFLVFTNYTSKIKDLNAILAQNQSQKASLLKLTEEVQKKKKLMKDFSLASSKASWYLDQIGMAVPSSITLSEIQWQPLLKNIKDDAPVETIQQTMIIKGISNKGDDFSNWLSTLEQLDWVEQVSINGYGSGKKAETSFELEIKFKA